MNQIVKRTAWSGEVVVSHPLTECRHLHVACGVEGCKDVASHVIDVEAGLLCDYHTKEELKENE